MAGFFKKLLFDLFAINTIVASSLFSWLVYYSINTYINDFYKTFFGVFIFPLFIINYLLPGNLVPLLSYGKVPTKTRVKNIGHPLLEDFSSDLVYRDPDTVDEDTLALIGNSASILLGLP